MSGRTIIVTREQIEAAKLRVAIDRQLRQHTPEWIQRVALYDDPSGTALYLRDVCPSCAHTHTDDGDWYEPCPAALVDRAGKPGICGCTTCDHCHGDGWVDEGPRDFGEQLPECPTCNGEGVL